MLSRGRERRGREGGMDGWGGEREAARAEAGERIGGRGSENCAATRRRAIFGAGAIADRRARATPRAPHGAPRRRRAPLRERALNVSAGVLFLRTSGRCPTAADEGAP
eukprot:30993-Pelagococcus_subviridis.AAC.3